jgi:hypothetical protein
MNRLNRTQIGWAFSRRNGFREALGILLCVITLLVPAVLSAQQVAAAVGVNDKPVVAAQPSAKTDESKPQELPAPPPQQILSVIPGGHTILYYPTQECCQEITEGEFAILYAQGMQLAEPPEGWTVQSASAAVAEKLGWIPIKRQWSSDRKSYTYKRKGWHLSEYLTEEVFFDGLKASKDPQFDRKPFTNGFRKDDLVTQLTPNTEGNFELLYTAGDPDEAVRIPKVRAAVTRCDCVTEGEFAALFAQKIQIDPRVRVWTADRAANELLAKCYYPTGGWRLPECLTNEDFANLLRGTEYELPVAQAVNPHGYVSPLEVMAALEKRPVTTQGELAIYYANRIGLRPPEGGWTSEAAIQRLQGYNLSPAFGWVQCAPGCAYDFEKFVKRAALPVLFALTGPQSCEPLRVTGWALTGGPPTNPPPPPPPDNYHPASPILPPPE